MMGPHEAAPVEPQEPTEAEQFGAALFREIAEARAPLHEPIRLFPLGGHYDYLGAAGRSCTC